MKITLVHQNSPSLVKEVKKEGFSWGAFLLGVLWYWFHGMWGKGFVYLIIGLLVCWTYIGIPIMWVVMGFRFNKEYYEYLLEKGYKEGK